MVDTATKNLILMRHAKSDWIQGVDDMVRPISDRGVTNAHKMGDWLSATICEPVEIVHSPARRTTQTAEIIVKYLDCTRVQAVPALYLADVQQLAEIISASEAPNLLLIGHNPGLEELIWYLAPEQPALMPFKKLFPTAAIYQFSIPLHARLRGGGGEFIRHQRPSALDNET